MAHSVEQFENFAGNLNSRLVSHGPSLVSEDCVRYDFFCSLVSSGATASNCLLEYPHPHGDFRGREVDFVLVDADRKHLSAVEIKYFKRIPSGKQDRTGYMAKLMIDLLKLHHLVLGEAKKYFIMATDNVMKVYLRNNLNGFSSLLSTPLGVEFNVSAGSKAGKNAHFNKILLKNVRDVLDPFNCNMRLVRIFERDISIDHSVYIFEVV